METTNFDKKRGFPKSFFLNSIRVPTEFQLTTWENEGGFLFGACEDAVIVNGVLCRSWKEKLGANIRPLWQSLKRLLGASANSRNKY